MKNRAKVIGYCRLTYGEQRKDLTIEEQKKEILEYGKRDGFKVVEWFIDDPRLTQFYKGNVLNRAIRYCEEHPEIYCLQVTDFSKISRSAEELKYWQDRFEAIKKRIWDIDYAALDASSRCYSKLPKETGSL